MHIDQLDSVARMIDARTKQLKECEKQLFAFLLAAAQAGRNVTGAETGTESAGAEFARPISAEDVQRYIFGSPPSLSDADCEQHPTENISETTRANAAENIPDGVRPGSPQSPSVSSLPAESASMISSDGESDKTPVTESSTPASATNLKSSKPSSLSSPSPGVEAPQSEKEGARLVQEMQTHKEALARDLTQLQQLTDAIQANAHEMKQNLDALKLPTHPDHIAMNERAATEIALVQRSPALNAFATLEGVFATHPAAAASQYCR